MKNLLESLTLRDSFLASQVFNARKQGVCTVSMLVELYVAMAFHLVVMLPGHRRIADRHINMVSASCCLTQAVQNVIGTLGLTIMSSSHFVRESSSHVGNPAMFGRPSGDLYLNVFRW